MKISRIKAVTMIAVIMMLTSTITLFASVSAHQPPISIPTYVYVAAAPNPVGLNQIVNFAFWNTLAPPEGATDSSIRWTFTVTVTDPDNTATSLGNFVSNVDGRATAQYVPNKVGTWSVTVNFPQTKYTYNTTAAQSLWTDDTFLASSNTANFTVQEQPISEEAYHPLPREYWLSGTEGASVTGVYAGAGQGQTFGNHNIMYRDQTTGSLTAHVMWTKPLESGGQVGGQNVNIWGNTFYQGLAYNQRFNVGTVYVLDGKLYYRESGNTNSGTAGGYIAVDLRTGQEVLRTTLTSLGMAYSHNGVSMFASTSFGNLLDPYLNPMPFTLTGVPTSGTMLMGNHSEVLRLSIANLTTAGSPRYNLLQWNSSKVIKPGLTGTIPAGGPEAYDFNVTIPISNMPSTTIQNAFVDDCLLVHNMSDVLAVNNPNATYRIITLSLKPGSQGQVLGDILLNPNSTAPFNQYEQGNLLLTDDAFEPNSKVMPIWTKWNLEWVGLNTITGKTWVSEPENAWTYYASPDGTNENRDAFVSAGMLIDVSWSGVLYAYDMTNGQLKFTYGLAGKTVNANISSSGLETVYGNYPSAAMAATLSNGIVYTIVNEHSPNTPHLKRSFIRCIDVINQKELWMLPTFGGIFSTGNNQGLVANDFTVFLNAHDQQIWAVGKGLSDTKVQIPMQTMMQGNRMIVEGTIVDKAAGTNQQEQAARFPFGVPCVADGNMTQWMEYVYSQHGPRPEVKGVDITLTAIAPDGTTENIGTTTSDSTGYYSIDWTPNAAGTYTVIAKFAGTDAYYASEAQSTIAIDSAPEPSVTPTPTPAPMTDTYLLAATGGIIAAIFILAAVIIIFSKKR